MDMGMEPALKIQQLQNIKLLLKIFTIHIDLNIQWVVLSKYKKAVLNIGTTNRGVEATINEVYYGSLNNEDWKGAVLARTKCRCNSSSIEQADGKRGYKHV